MRAEDVYELRWAADPRVSPDGRMVAYTVVSVDREENTYRSAIWLAAADGSGEPRRLTAGTRRDASPRWSPDGRRIAFVSNRDTEKVAQLYVMRLDGGDPVRLTDLPEDAAEPAWSPDGERIAFTSRVRDPAYEEEDDRKRPPRRVHRLRYKLDNVGWTIDRPKHVFVVAADASAAPEQLTTGDAEDGEPAWSPDGERLAFASARHPDWDIDTLSDIYVVAASGGEPERITPNDGACSSPSWSPDGERMLLGVKKWAYADRITTPLLILHAENDLRCPVEQGEQLFATLRLKRREVEMVRFTGEGHEHSRSGSPAHRVQRFEVITEWFDRHLQ